MVSVNLTMPTSALPITFLPHVVCHPNWDSLQKAQGAVNNDRGPRVNGEGRYPAPGEQTWSPAEGPVGEAHAPAVCFPAHLEMAGVTAGAKGTAPRESPSSFPGHANRSQAQRRSVGGGGRGSLTEEALRAGAGVPSMVTAARVTV